MKFNVLPSRIGQLSLVALLCVGLLASGAGLARGDDGRSHRRDDRWEARHDHQYGQFREHRPARGHEQRFHNGKKTVRVERVVRELPRRSHRVVIDRNVYYRDGNHFYSYRQNGYVRVRPPVGVVVSSLPYGFVQVSIGGIRHFRYDNVYYRPTASGYLVVNVPLGATYWY